MNNFLCKIGLHDWKIIKMDSVPQLWEDVRAELTDKFAMDVRAFGYPYLNKKICRRCEKIVDEITPYKEKIKPKVLREIELERKANEMCVVCGKHPIAYDNECYTCNH